MLPLFTSRHLRKGCEEVHKRQCIVQIADSIDEPRVSLLHQMVQFILGFLVQLSPLITVINAPPHEQNTIAHRKKKKH